MSNYTYYGTFPSDELLPVLGGIAGFLGVFMLLVFLIGIAISILFYVFYSCGLYSIAKRRGLRHAWLSWIPDFGQIWILGSISDQYHYMVKGNIHKRRTTMLLLYIIEAVIFVPAYAVSTLSRLGVGREFFGAGTLGGAGVALLMLACAAAAVMSIVLMVLYYMSLYDLYASCDPSNGTLYIILSILINVTRPFLVFSSRKHDLGMQFLHPRYTQAQQPPVIESQAEPVAPAPSTEAPVVESVVVESAPEPIVSAPVVEEDVATEPPVAAVVEDVTEEPTTEEAPAQEAAPGEESDPT